MILKTKLYPPQTHVELIARPRLIELLNRGVANRLTLISAPAGYGKSTLLGEWISQLDAPVGWLSLDETDQDFVRFLTYFIAALQEIDPSLGASTLGVLSGPTSFSQEEILTELVNEMADFPTGFVLVLDDYHFINTLTIHQAITFLLDNAPPQFHLIIATRNDPALPMARWRIRRQIGEVREADLRFTLSETGAFLKQVLGYDLQSEQVVGLNNRTEGWIAGLQMAGLSLARLGEEETAKFIQDFTGGNRHLVDFLMDEVFARQSEEVQQFLLYTSVLDRFSAPLCQTVVGKDFSSQTLIEHLERANLFLIPLDAHRQWYRYHRLFADFLSHRLQTQASDQIMGIHRRASRWFEANGYWNEAVHQANAIGDIEFITDMITKQATTLLYESEFPTVERWLNLLTDETILTNPVLCTVKAWIYYFRRQNSDAAVLYLDRADMIIHQDEITDSEMGQRIAHSVNALRAWVARAKRDLETALQISQQALIGLPENNVDVLALSEMFIADTLRHLGRFAEALPHYQRGYRQAQLCGNYSVMTGATFYQAEMLAQLDRIAEAKAQLQHTLAWFESQGMADQPSIALLEVGLGRRLIEERDFIAAEAHLKRGLQIGVPERPKIFIPALLGLAQVSQAQSKMEQAQEYLQQAEILARKYNLEEDYPQISEELASTDLQAEIVQAQKPTRSAPTQQPQLIEPLTERERKILTMLNTDLTGPEIAQTLFVALSTVRFHTKNIYAKLGVSNRMAAVNQAKEVGLL